VNHISAKTKILAVIGDPIQHSMSPKMHNAALRELGLDYVYVAYHVRPETLGDAVRGFRALNVRGINVTIPHKVEIIPHLDEVDETAAHIGAINTILNDNGVLRAKNTDGEGALKSLTDAGFDPTGKKVVVLGAGGAARAICYYLAQKVASMLLLDVIPANATTLAASLQSTYGIQAAGLPLDDNLLRTQLADADLLVNCSPIGMHPRVDETPVPKAALHPGLFVFDIIYNPLETRLLREANELGCVTLSGLDMFVNQGLLAFEWWTGVTPPKALMQEVVLAELQK
jgi:shikimate dehydrogenase